MASSMRGRTLLCATLLIVLSTIPTQADDSEQVEVDCPLLFDGELANESVHFQTSLGPRVPGSAPSSALRESIKENLTGWKIIETTHHSEGMVLTNLFATWNEGAGSEVIIAAHYDSRDRAERDWNESRRDEPIPGANDAASGVAVLLELARHIPNMNLSHEVTLFFTDGEDQGIMPSFLGAKAWSENLTEEEADAIESFVLVDMVGDEFLTLTRITLDNDTLWDRVVTSMNQVETKCGNVVSDYYDDNETINVWDDHIMALNVGIPAVDIIDIKYGENATAFGGHWHTHNDTDDKVSAESLQTVGRIVENGLVEGLFLDVRIDEATEDGQEPTNATQELEVDEETESSDQDIIGAIMMAVSVLIFGILVWTIVADK